jgi:hypothetical protein
MLETPFIYVYDGTGLTDGQSYRARTVLLDGDSDFVLRKVAGAALVAPTFRLYDGKGRPCSSDPWRAGNHLTIAPEIVYERGSAIRFDVEAVSRTFITCANPIFASYICFQGVKRWHAPGRPVNRRMTVSPWSFTQDLTVDWFHYVGSTSGPRAAGRNFYVAVDDFEFELQNISIINTAGTAMSSAVILFRLFDAGGRATSDQPVPQMVVNARSDGWGGCFPVPSLVYPVGSKIRFEVVSMVCNSDTAKNLQFRFEGQRRLPR